MEKIKSIGTWVETQLNKLGNWPFITGALQVSLVSMNTYQIVHSHWISAFIVGCGISFIWTFNVKAALGTWKGRLLYTLGAGCGVMIGMLVNKFLLA